MLPIAIDIEIAKNISMRTKAISFTSSHMVLNPPKHYQKPCTVRVVCLASLVFSQLDFWLITHKSESTQNRPPPPQLNSQLFTDKA